ncbi:hypothetical protein PS15p_212275 [Mucor circinelloides]
MENTEIRAKRKVKEEMRKKRRAGNKEYSMEEAQIRASQRHKEQIKKRMKPKQQNSANQPSAPSPQVVDSSHNIAEFHDDDVDIHDFDCGYDYCDTGSPSQPNETIREYALAIAGIINNKNRKDFWGTMSVDVKNWFSKSFELNGHPNPCLVAPNTSILGTYACNCADAKDFAVYCYMLHSHTSFKLKYCDEHPIMKTLLLMQMLPSSTVSPKVAIHFAVFEKLQSLKLHGYMSNYAFVKSQNKDNLILADYDIQKFKFLNNGLFNNTQILYRNIKSHVLNDTYSLQYNIKSFNCHACDGADRVGVALDGNFQMKRKNNKRIIENSEEYPSILSVTADVTHTFGKNEEVEKYEYEVDDNKEEVCGLDEIDNSFKANGNHDRKKNSDRFDELGLFSMNCARHGIPMRLYDIYGGEGRKYPLACINRLISTLDSNQKVLIMYDIICLCKEKLESCIPQLKTKDPLYLVTVFHAYAHSMHCQVAFHPRVIDGSGHTDGEGVERFWSICNRFSGVTRNMSKYNRQALIADVVFFFRSNKMLEIPGQIALKFRKSLKKICDLNITNQEFTKLQQQWKEHVAALSTPATPSGIKEMLDRAEKQERTANKSTYIRLAAQYLQLTQKMKDNDQKKISNSRLISQSNALAKKIRALADKCGFSIITSFDHHYFTGHSEEVREVRYSALNDFFKHIIFSIIIREARLAQPGTSGKFDVYQIIVAES